MSAVSVICEAYRRLRKLEKIMSDNPQLKNFAIIYHPGPNWIVGKQSCEQQQLNHALYMKKLIVCGILMLGGPFTDEGGGGQAVIQAENQAAAEEILRNDPAQLEGVMIGELRAWHQVDWRAFGK